MTAHPTAEAMLGFGEAGLYHGQGAAMAQEERWLLGWCDDAGQQWGCRLGCSVQRARGTTCAAEQCRWARRVLGGRLGAMVG